MESPAPGLTGRRAGVLGAGRQGLCAAYDFVRYGGASALTLLDGRAEALADAERRLRALLPGIVVDTVRADAQDETALSRALAGCATALCALPYRFAPIAARAAVAARCSLVDLGGNTEVSHQLLSLHEAARAAGVALIPDTGLAPGLGNTLAADGLESLDQPEAVRIWCGGLPQRPIPPLGYRLVFSAEGLINEYSGEAIYLQGGELVRVPTLSEITPFEFPGVGRLEAAPTSGGTSTAPETFQGQVATYEYRTLRYPGHFEKFRSFKDLGLFAETPIEGSDARPRDLLIRLLTPLIDHPEVPDMIVLRVETLGRRGGRRVRRTHDLLDRQDPDTGFTAMERCTAHPAAIVAEMAACGEVAPGARPLEVAAPPKRFLARFAARPIVLTLREEAL